MQDTQLVLRSMFLTADPSSQKELMDEASKLQKAVQVLVEKISTLGYTKTEGEIKLFLLEYLPGSLTTEEIEKCHTSVTKCNFDVRVSNCLAASEIKFVGDLIQMSEKELIQIPNLGRKSINEIKCTLEDLGLKLDTNIPNWEILKSQHQVNT